MADRDRLRSLLVRAARNRSVQLCALYVLCGAMVMDIGAACSLLVDGVAAKRTVWLAVWVLGVVGCAVSIGMKLDPPGSRTQPDAAQARTDHPEIP